MSNRIPCSNNECVATILQTTFEKTGGFCMPCYQEMKRKEHMEFVSRNRRDVNLYENIEDPVEILKIMHTPVKYNELINYIKYDKRMEEVYLSLSEEEIERMKRYALKLIEKGDLEDSKEILLAIVCYTNTKIEQCLRALIDEEEYYPAILYKDSPKDVRDRLIHIVENEAISCDLNRILDALAWIGDQKVVELFWGFKQNPPTWKDELFWNPHEYSLGAGWTLTEEGKQKNLFYDECYSIERKSLSKCKEVQFLEKASETCPWCGENLINLMSLDLRKTLFNFMGIEGKKLNVKTCYVCTAYDCIYTDVDFNGNAQWSKFNKEQECTNEEIDIEFFQWKNEFDISEEKRSPYYAAHQFLDTTFSQIGGHPTWIQDPEYPRCPKCSEHMKFIGQLDSSDYEEYGEGIYYMFVCEKCRVVATNYQQT